MNATVITARRTASRAARRQQLIDATMKCIARKGIGSTTLADVAKEAGLSQGIVNLHFESKDNLLKETLRALANEYREKFDRALKNSGPHPADKLLALVEHDIRPSICNQGKLAIWFAFWGEVKSRPTYRRMCDEWDRHYEEVVAGFCAQLIADGNYRNIEAATVANALSCMTNGLWLSCLISPQTWDRNEALEAIMSYLHGVFPKHYPQ
ncbi:MAG: TetR family transcriptional regulator C-terminal domain-containing protein [Gammaproteobacteria bacterium]|nr:TetR family transcriptional regulator C-terminal domain-containing protein [Gammaproteobacteria bacterium]